MMNIVLLKKARECKSLTCGVKPEALASRKGDSSDAVSEVSGTAKLCTDEQKLHKRHIAVDECAQLVPPKAWINTKSEQNYNSYM